MDDQISLIQVGEDNDQNVRHSFELHSDVNSFLKDEDIVIPIHSSAAGDSSINYPFDLDGVCMELFNLASIQTGIHYLFIPILEEHMLRGMYIYIKKHFTLSQYSQTGLHALKNAMGHVVGHADGSYFVNLAVYPKDFNYTGNFEDPHRARWSSCRAWNSIFTLFKTKLKSLPHKEMARASIMKNTLHNLSKMNVLKQDLKFILEILDSAIVQTDLEPELEVGIFLTKFGFQICNLVHHEETYSC